MKGWKKAAALCLFVFAVFALKSASGTEKAEPNLYGEDPYGRGIIGVNFPFSAISGQGSLDGLGYNSIEEIKETPDDIFSLSISYTKLNNSEILSRFENLETLVLSDSEINDFSFLKKLKKLKCLYISSCVSDDFNSIRYLPNKKELAVLTIHSCKNKDSSLITDISFLEGFTGLIFLNLGGNDVRNLDPIAGMSKLETIYLYDNFHIESLKPLHNLENIKDGIIPPTYQYTKDDLEYLGDPMSSNIYYD